MMKSKVELVLLLLFCQDSFLVSSDSDVQRALKRARYYDEIIPNRPLRQEGIPTGYSFCNTGQETNEAWRNILLAAGYSEEQIAAWRWQKRNPTSDEIFLSDDVRLAIKELNSKFSAMPNENKKYFFKKEECLKALQIYLRVNRAGIQTKFDNGPVVSIRYNLSQKYVLYLVGNETNYKYF